MPLQVDQQDPKNTVIEHSQNFILRILTQPSTILTLEILYIFITDSSDETDLPVLPDHNVSFRAPFTAKSFSITVRPAYMINLGDIHYGFQLLTNGSGTYELEIRPHISFLLKSQNFKILIFKNDGDLLPYESLPFTIKRDLIFPPIKSDQPVLRYPFTLNHPIPYGQSPLPCSSMAAPFDTPITLTTLHLARAPKNTSIVILSEVSQLITYGLTFPSNYRLTLLDTKLSYVDHTNTPMSSRFETSIQRPLADFIPLSSGIPLSQRFTNYHKGGLRIQLTEISVFNQQVINKDKRHERKVHYISKLAIDFLNSLPPPTTNITSNRAANPLTRPSPDPESFLTDE